MNNVNVEEEASVNNVQAFVHNFHSDNGDFVYYVHNFPSVSEGAGRGEEGSRVGGREEARH